MADDGHRELAAASLESSFEPCQLPLVHRAQYAGVDRKKSKIIGLKFEKGRPLGADIYSV
jgi:hypothetical protein